MSEDMLGGITLASVAGLINDLFSKLTGPDGHLWLSAFKRFLRKENPWPKLPTWRTVKLGTHKSVEALTKAIETGGSQLSNWARDISNKVTLAKAVSEVELVTVTVAELGFPKGATRKDIYDRAISLGLSLCPAEVGMQLRLRYEDQPKGEWLLVAMEPIADSGVGLCVFYIGHDGDGRWLNTDSGHPGYVWHAGRRWVFLR